MSLALDLYHPTTSPRATVLFAHGGGFFKGDRRSGRVADLAKALTAAGYAMASASYRLATPLAAFPDDERHRITANRRRSRRAGLTLANRLMGSAFEAARRDLGAAIGFLDRDRDRLGIGPGKIGMIGISAGGIAGLSLAFPPRDLPAAPAPASLLALSGAMVQPWRLTPDAPPCLMLHSVEDKIIAPQNATLAARRAAATGAPLRLLTCGRRGHNATIRALLEDADETGKPYWDHMLALFDSAA